MRSALVLVLFVVPMNRAAAELAFVKPTVDLGRVGSGKILEHVFECANLGDYPLEIVETKASCGCMQPVVEPRQLPPKKEGRITVKVNSLRASAGVHFWTVQVRYKQDDLMHEVVLTVKAEVVQELLVQPPALIISTDAPVQHQIVVTDLRAKPLRLRQVKTSAAHLQAVIAGEEKNAQGQPVYTINVRVTPEAKPGRHEDHLVLHADDEEYRQLIVPVTLTMRSKQRMMALPSAVELLLADDQPRSSRLLTLRDSQQLTHQIESASADHPAISVSFSQGPSKVGTVKVTVDRSKVQGSTLKAHVLIGFSEPAGEKLVIPVKCELR
jgi:hypothetical protein